MKVTFNSAIAGVNFAYRSKREYDLPDHVAKAFIDSGHAVKVRPTRSRAGKLVEVAQRIAGEFRS